MDAVTIRCYISPDAWSEGDISLPPDEAHHVLHVLRAKEGALLEVFDGVGHKARAELVSVSGKNKATVRIKESLTAAPPAVQIALVQAVSREQKMDLVIQKATELGVSAVVPVETAHAVVRLKPGQTKARLARWQKIVLNAAKQSGAYWLPTVTPVQPLSTFLATPCDADLALGCSLDPSACPLRDVLKKADRAPSRVTAFVGPEGDFSSEEYADLLAWGAVPIRLGDQVLRTETAALYVLSVLQYEFGGRSRKG